MRVGEDGVPVAADGEQLRLEISSLIEAWQRAFRTCNPDLLVSLYWADAAVTRVAVHRESNGGWGEVEHHLSVGEFGDRILAMCEARRLNVQLGRLHFSDESPQRIPVAFRQVFEAYTRRGGLVYRDDGIKYLVFQRRGTEWRIISENWRAMAAPTIELDDGLPMRRVLFVP